MFLHLLNETQKQCYCSVAQFVLAADGVVEDREKRLIETARLEMGLTETPARITGIAMLPQVLGVFSTPLSQRILLLEVTAAALADGVLQSKEREILEAIAGAFGLPPDTIGSFAGFATRAAALTDEGWRLVIGA